MTKCSRSHVIRAAFTICDACCADLGIALIAGQHVGINSDLSRSVSRPPSAIHFRPTSQPQNKTHSESNSETSSIISQPSASARGWGDYKFVDDASSSVAESVVESIPDNEEDFLALGGEFGQGEGDGDWVKVKQRQMHNSGFDDDVLARVKSLSVNRGRGSVSSFRQGNAFTTRQSALTSPWGGTGPTVLRK